ncbi:MAG TPA: PadR family transcriptional regulator [Terriglobales bacterium]|nr:PadR family transcriptional regulator [Terriglobales bacterium]
MFDGHQFRHWGPHRMFQKGDFKYLILDLLKDKPRYGYEIIRELEDRFHGFYSPSPGTVYPTLQYLEDMGHVTSREQDGKRIYTITADGLKFLETESKTVEDVFGRMRHGWEHWWSSDLRDQFRDVMGEIAELGRLIGRRARGMNRDKLRRIGEVLKRAYAEVEKIISEEPPSAV